MEKMKVVRLSEKHSLIIIVICYVAWKIINYTKTTVW